MAALPAGDEDYFSLGRDARWEHPLAGALDEVAKARGLELAVIEQLEPAAERVARVVAFEIVGRVEQILTARLALAARQRA